MFSDVHSSSLSLWYLTIEFMIPKRWLEFEVRQREKEATWINMTEQWLVGTVYEPSNTWFTSKGHFNELRLRSQSHIHFYLFLNFTDLKFCWHVDQHVKQHERKKEKHKCRQITSAAVNAISRQPGAQKTVNIWHWRTQHVGGHPQQCVQQIVDLSVPLHDVGKLLVVHKLHVGPRVRGHMLTNKGKVKWEGEKCLRRCLQENKLLLKNS